MLVALVIAASVGACDSVGMEEGPYPEHPDAVQVTTADMARFWKAFDEAVEAPTVSEQVEAFQTEYVNKATPGLRDFMERRVGSATNLRKAVFDRKAFYGGIRPAQEDIQAGAMQAEIRAAFHELERIYPDAVYPNVYFVVGGMSTGGTVSETGLLIGTELFSASSETPLFELSEWERAVVRSVEELPAIVAHEAVHIQQRRDSETLLARALAEGGADFIGQMTSGRIFNQHLHAYGDANEEELWGEFSYQMNRQEIDRWLYNAGAAPEGRPADMGYYVGYKICEAYYAQAEDKTEAIRQIMLLKDPEGILEESGYGDQFDSNIL